MSQLERLTDVKVAVEKTGDRIIFKAQGKACPNCRHELEERLEDEAHCRVAVLVRDGVVKAIVFQRSSKLIEDEMEDEVATYVSYCLNGHRGPH